MEEEKNLAKLLLEDALAGLAVVVVVALALVVPRFLAKYPVNNSGLGRNIVVTGVFAVVFIAVGVVEVVVVFAAVGVVAVMLPAPCLLA